MYTHILKNCLNFNYGRSYENHVILEEKYASNNRKRKGLKDEKRVSVERAKQGKPSCSDQQLLFTPPRSLVEALLQ